MQHKGKTERQTEHTMQGGSKMCSKGISSSTLKNEWRNIPFCPYCSPCKLGQASKQGSRKCNFIKKEDKNCIEGAKCAAKNISPTLKNVWHNIPFNFFRNSNSVSFTRIDCGQNVYFLTCKVSDVYTVGVC